MATSVTGGATLVPLRQVVHRGGYAAVATEANMVFLSRGGFTSLIPV